MSGKIMGIPLVLIILAVFCIGPSVTIGIINLNETKALRSEVKKLIVPVEPKVLATASVTPTLVVTEVATPSAKMKPTVAPKGATGSATKEK
jgi:hypothetical protein